MWKTISDENPVTDGPLLLFTHIVGANGPACPYLSPEIRYPTFSLSPRATVQIKIFNTPAEFREWLEENHDRVSEIWLGFYNKRTDKRSTTYREALDEALCFGWIDGVRKSVDETTYKQRFTPRRPNSYWSAVNIRRADELARLGRMSAPGAKAFEQRTSDSGKYSFESRPKKLPLVYQRQFKANRTAWEFFRAQAPWYQRTSTFWVVSAKREETRQRRLATLMSDSEKGRRLSILTPKPKKTQDS
jgi:uncharacterized protein YdeI (YjbR/CyaY-like superfamily)